ncbi:uncharacterized protein LOC8057512 [Sorghum bicolor]|uniref:Ubiquitin-like protease family profile domain-containing protein n=1 Tax=Sorghum bicolor TaxID=4558 RepID=A0A1W0VY29_SORBI|nr:uncharacterized protein LOC8057512 [Sorghum bicolor]OQU87048.1 hypothetical protein SORBI_3003G198016 [Sorghum bicolor]OQU87049.1 hypothetical protein SORBI_3003G198016 [Sorghum bicolor]OQU87050.1 hypothetical protein SORBI_3003G198016 [Sorghum bicolor]|eukprot:XP_021313112.1 uncharacterized protein LOC8057512 [Sorghum bicolor]
MEDEDEDEDEEDEEVDKEVELEDEEVAKEVELEDEGVSGEDDATNKVDPPAGDSRETEPTPLEVVPSQSRRERLRLPPPASVVEKNEKSKKHTKVDAPAGDSRESEPTPLEVVPSQSRRERLRLPPSASVVENKEKSEKHSKWDFDPPPMDIMRFIDFPTPRERPPSKPSECNSERNARKYDDDYFWDNLSEEQFKELDAQIEDIERNRTDKLLSSSAVKQTPVPTDNPIEHSERKPTRVEKTTSATTYGLQSAPSTSHTPAYQPPPRRPARPGRALQSPYIDYARNGLKCSKVASRAYDVVCSATRRSTRSSSQSSSQGDEIIISYPDYYVSLKHLSESVKPGGKLFNTVAEIAIYALKDRKAKIPVKQILPLRIASFLQDGILDNGEINCAFQRSLHHLDRSQLVMFPVLQNIRFKRLDRTVGHFFLLVLNLREERFEVLDSMRSLADINLKTCCNNLITAIKELWRKHYPNSRKNIDKYQLIDINVPLQSNNHDCGFHMLMHCEHWNGINMPEFKEKDMPTIRKMLTYKWLQHPENNIAWRCKMNIC